MKKLSWSKILLIVIVVIIIVLGIVFLVSCKSGKCIFGGATAYKANAAGCAMNGRLQLPIRASTGQCLEACGAAPQCSAAYPLQSWMDGDGPSGTSITNCHWCDNQCQYKTLYDPTGGMGLNKIWNKGKVSGSTCNYRCDIVCRPGQWQLEKCKSVDKNKACDKSVCTSYGGWDNSLCSSAQRCDKTTHSLDGKCLQTCGASKECSSAYPKQFWVVGDSCRWCTDKCIYTASQKTKKNCPGAVCSTGGWSYPKSLNCY